MTARRRPVPGLSMRAYALHRKRNGLNGQTHTAVRKAVKEGRLEGCVKWLGNGHARIDPVKADAAWTDNTTATKQREPKAAAAPAEPAADQGELFEDSSEGTAAPATKGDAAGPSLAKSLAVQAVYKAQLTRLEYLKRSGELVDKERVDSIAFRAARSVRDNVLKIPDRISAQLSAEKDPVVIRETLTTELTAALDSLANELAKL